LPQQAELDRLDARRGELAGRRVALETQVSDLGHDQRKADVDVERVKERRIRNQQRLETGAVSSPRDLEQLQQEVVSLERRISSLEDTELEVMEQLESAQRFLAEVTAETDEMAARAGELQSALDQAVSDLDAQARVALGERELLVSDLPEPLVTLYERMRSQADGVGAAALRRRRCEGCRLELTASDMADTAAAAPDEVLRCPECNRILVRMSDIGV